MSSYARPILGAVCLAAFAACPAAGQMLVAANTAPETVIVTGERSESDLPNKIESVDAADAAVTINAVNTEDMMKYMPSIVVRKRHYGDTQDPLATRTSGVGASARSLLFVDGILISSPIGNNNTTASPHFGIAQPEDISNFQVLYGPFAAEYAGGSIGAVLNITTKMPDHFTLYADALGAVQPFSQYATDHTYGTWQLSAGIGDRDGAFSWRLSATHLDSVGQPLAYVTLTRPASPSTAGVAATGAFNDFNRTAAPIVVIGAGGIESQTQDTDTLKLAYDFANGWQATYTASVFHQIDDASAASYLRDAGGNAVYSGNANINGYNYTIAASSFSNNVYDWNQTHLAQAMTLKSGAGGDFGWEFVASDYNYLDDNQRVPSVALPGDNYRRRRQRSTASMAPAGTHWTSRASGKAGPGTSFPSAPIVTPRPSPRSNTTPPTGSPGFQAHWLHRRGAGPPPTPCGCRTSGVSRRIGRRPWVAGSRIGAPMTGSISRHRRR